MNPYTQHLPFPLAVEIDILLDEFEQAWEARQAPRIEDFLARVPAEAARPVALRSLLMLDMDLRRKSGESIEFDEYLRRFPLASAEVEAALEYVRQSEANARSIADTQTGGPHSLSGTAEPARTPRQTAPETDLPEYIGRYRVQKQLGVGGFGIVYQADDPDLKRSVALKLPRADRDWTDEELERFLEEARTAVRLTHDGIVRVHDVFRDGERVAVVQEYIDGRDLAAEIEGGVLGPERCVALMLSVCEALAFAHQQGFVHRDLKPGNILLDDKGQPHIADFGMAVHESLQRRRRDEVAGTPAYMSPEQVRGETHRLDGRSDIWSLGVILYEMLTGRRPFSGERRSGVFDEIKHRDPRPLRQINPKLPAELERICLKCLAKRATDRYSSAVDLADDLRQWRAGDPKPKTATPVVVEKPKVVPKGLRSFGEEDADFFLDLLPGPRGREGLPESIRFWKSRIEEADPDKTFSVGLIYGPSGCGKSSLMKAGLLPRLASHVIPIYVEATPADTEARLLKGLRKVCPDIPEEISLPELFESLREGLWVPRGKKLTIVLDQFEQWLHSHRGEEETQLVQALRQCDGERVQCVVMIRDDFWVATSRFSKSLEIRLLDGQNAALVDLFDPLHAHNVLAEFGRAYGRLPENPGELTADQEAFLESAVTGLSQEGKVICVRLALFADMLKGRQWNTSSLREVGGAEGLGFTFLEETFSASTAPAEHRQHQRAAREVLKSLLPESGTEIKGGMKSYDQLLEASGYARRPEDFDDVIRILDPELRLITPTDPEGKSSEDGQFNAVTDEPSRKYYQLTHDYLVHSLREWLTRKQRETRQGRAELCLAERAALWNAKPERQQLPSLWECFNIVAYVPQRNRTEPQQRMMKVATRHYAFLVSGALAAVLFAAVALQLFLTAQHRNLVRGKVDALQSTMGAGVPFAIQGLEELSKTSVVRELRNRLSDPKVERKLPLEYALAKFERPDCQFLVNAVPSSRAEELDNLVTALEHARVPALQELKNVAVDTTAKKDWALKTRLATVAMYLGDTAIAAEMLGSTAPDPVQRTMFIEHLPKWSGNWLKLVPVLRETNNASLRSGMSLALGGIKDPEPGAQRAWQEVFTEWHRDQPDSGTHSASGWALRTWGANLPKVDAMRPGRDWQQTKMGLTMFRIPAGEVQAPSEDGKTKRIRITQEFWLSDREIDQGLFSQFLSDKDAERPEEISQTGNGDPSLPATFVSWYDAVMFCNWLSSREGRDRCYQKDGKERSSNVGKIREYDAWKLIAGANGYRLPTDDEWEYACRAGTTTAFAFGDAEELLDRYAVFAGNAKGGPGAVGRKLCNAWGLFDMHGNVDEWCADLSQWYADLSELVGSGRSFGVLRGGCWDNDAGKCRAAVRSWSVPSNRNCALGFRVALVPSAEASQPAGGAGSGSR